MKITSKRAFVLIVLLAVLWFLRPWWHGLFMVFWISPLSLILVLMLIGGIFSLVRQVGSVQFIKTGPNNYSLKSSNHISTGVWVGYAFVLIIIIFGLALEGEIRAKLTAEQITYEPRTTLPTFDPVRLTPKQVATRYAEDTFQNPQEHLGDSQIVLVDGKLQRVSPRLPDGALLYFFNKMSGFVSVEVDTLDRKVQISDQEFKYSDGVGIFDNIFFRLPLKKYAVSYSSEPIYLKNDVGAWVTEVPYIKYTGFPFRVPEWGGVMEVQSNGTMIDRTPEEAMNVSYLKGNRIYPKELTVYYTNSYSYNKGIINKWFLHKNETEIVSLPNDENVIHSATNEGFKQIVVAEPYGRSYGIYKIFIFDATTGKREIVEYDQNSQLTGPVAAADYIKKAFPSYSWDTFSLTEPRPVTINGDLNWLLSIIPNDAAGIAKTVLMDAKTNQVTGVDTEAQLNAILAGTVMNENPTTPTTPTDTNAQIKVKIDAIQSQLDQLRALVQ